ncbi:unnamed protein product, partial [Discosporangium mesarthrocarpum]
MITTHNSYTTDAVPSTHSRFEVTTSQRFRMLDQLQCLGVRGLEMDPHFVETLTRPDKGSRSEENATLLCHASMEWSRILFQACSVVGWNSCIDQGLPNLGPRDTGCSVDAPTLMEGLREVAEWLRHPENANEVIVIKVENILDGRVGVFSDIATEAFGRGIIFGQKESREMREYGYGGRWPTPEELVGAGKRVVFISTFSSDLVFRVPEVRTDVRHTTSALDSGSKGTPTPVKGPAIPRYAPWIRIQGSAARILVTLLGVKVFEHTPKKEDLLDEELVLPSMECGLTPSFDRFDQSLLKSTIWSWAPGFPLINNADLHADSASNTRTVGGSSVAKPVAAVASSADGRWREAAVDEPRGGFFEDGRETCEGEGLVFGCPRTAMENKALLTAM